jgi:hypothetical protein
MQGLYPVAKMSCTLKFTSKEIDPSSGEAESEGYEDEYTLEDIDVILTDFVNGNQLSAFRKVCFKPCECAIPISPKHFFEGMGCPSR